MACHMETFFTMIQKCMDRNSGCKAYYLNDERELGSNAIDLDLVTQIAFIFFDIPQKSSAWARILGRSTQYMPEATAVTDIVL